MTGRILEDKIKKYTGLFSGNIISKTINNVFFPEICSSCGEINEGFLCRKCRNDISEIKKISCNLCGAPFISDEQKFSASFSCSTAMSDKLFSGKQNLKIEPVLNNINASAKDNTGCVYCSEKGYNFYMLRSFGIYTGILKKLIIKFKYKKIYTLAPILNNFLKKTFEQSLFL